MTILAFTGLVLSYGNALFSLLFLVWFIFALMDGSEAVIAERLAARKGHFMPPSLLTSQLATLEVTPDVLRVSIEQTPEAIVDAVMTCLA